MEFVDCEKEGCDYTSGTVAGIRNHANANADHDWKNLKHHYVDGAEGEDDEQADDADDSMPSDDTLQKQRQKAQNDDDGDDDGDDGDGAPTTSPGIPLPVSTTTLAVGAVALVAVLLVASYARSDSGAENGVRDARDESGANRSDGSGTTANDSTGFSGAVDDAEKLNEVFGGE